MKTTSARENKPLSSPMESSSNTPGSASGRPAPTAAQTQRPRSASFLRRQVETLRLSRRQNQQQAAAARVARARNASMTVSSSSGGIVLAAIHTCSGASSIEKRGHLGGRLARLEIVLQIAGDQHLFAGAPASM